VDKAAAPAKTSKRRDRAATQDELAKAILRLQRRNTKLSISAVAREAAVTPALIHNVYPDVATEIRRLAGKSLRSQKDAFAQELAAEKMNSRSLRAELKQALKDLATQVSTNTTLRHEIEQLKALAEAKITRLPRRS
jgi:hypothetical protein